MGCVPSANKSKQQKDAKQRKDEDFKVESNSKIAKQ